jgi:hypothetical protein
LSVVYLMTLLIQNLMVIGVTNNDKEIMGKEASWLAKILSRSLHVEVCRYSTGKFWIVINYSRDSNRRK